MVQPEDDSSVTELLRRSRLAIGDVVGERYRLIELLGHGAMGQVFVAESLAIGIRVAIKLLKPEVMVDEVLRQRFLVEAQAIASIAHPNVARFLDLILGDPPFLVLEYVRGFTLADVLAAEGRLEVRRALSLAGRLAWGLAAVHAAGIIHRDLKPANIVVTSDAELGETPKIIDFGMAKRASDPRDSLTRTGQIVGTPHYMAPEQIAGREVDGRADVYALGCLLYEMVAGQTPFPGAAEDVELLYRHVHEPPEPLSRHVPDVTPNLDAVVARALAKSPAERFQTMPEFAKALASCASARHSVAGAITKPAPRRPRWPLPAAMGITLCAAAAGFVAGRHRPAAVPPPPTLLLLSSQPPGAQVEVDGRPLGEPTPTAVRGLAAGRHAIRLRLANHAEVRRELTLGAADRQLVEIALPPLARRVEVRTQPGGAMVFLDGRLAAGETPISLEVTGDDFHELRVEKAGYEPVVRGLGPDDPTVLDVTLVPETQPRGMLFVDSPIAAAVWIDGSDSGFQSPTIGLRVAEGEHTVELRDAQGKRLAQSKVHISRGATTRLSLGPHK